MRLIKLSILFVSFSFIFVGFQNFGLLADIPYEIAPPLVLNGGTQPIIGEEFIKGLLPDPDAMYDEISETTYLTGTGYSKIDIFSSINGKNFSLYKRINPSVIDPNFDYCSIWGPDLLKRANGKYHISFVAVRVPEGQICEPPTSGTTQVTVYYMEANNTNFNFTNIKPIDFAGPQGPRSKTNLGCFNSSTLANCERTIRIDPNLFVDPVTNLEHFFYVWFWKGNNISSFRVDNPNQFTRRVQHTQSLEESIIEAPDVFRRGSYYYFVMSRGSFNNSYRISYMYGTDLAKLRKGVSKIYDLTVPIATGENAYCNDHGFDNYTRQPIKENSGHSSTVKIGNDYYMYYHKPVFNYNTEGCHSIRFRHAYRKKLEFLPNGQIAPFQINYAVWNLLGLDYEYSLDVKMQGGEVQAPCKHAGILGGEHGALIDRNCYNGFNLDATNVSSMESVRVCGSNDNWNTSKCSPYKSLTRDRNKISLEIPTDSKTLMWDPLEGDYAYSLDLKLTNGSAVMHCVNAGTIGLSHSVAVDGSCPDAKNRKNPGINNIQKARICASNDGWKTGACSHYYNLKNQNGTPISQKIIKVNF